METDTELFVFARFYTLPGKEEEAANVLLDVLAPTREEAGCLGVHIFRSVRDSRLFYLPSLWVNEAAFDHHGELSHTLRFVERIEPLIDHPLDVNRTERIG